MEEKYSINEILNAINDLQITKKSNQNISLKTNQLTKNKSDIPTNTLKLIEEAEKTIKSNLQSE